MRTTYLLRLLLYPLTISLALVTLGLAATPALPTTSGPRFNVRDFGARGDGMADDTAAIQAAINAAPNGGSTIYFPAGTYISNNFQVINRSGLRFEGDGFASVIKRPPYSGNTRPATFEGSSDLTLTNLSVDENGIQAFGGMNFYNVRRVRIENTRHFDSNPQPTSADHYSYVFGQGGVPSEDIEILNNQIEDLNVELNQIRRARIEGNTVTRAWFGIGIWANGHGSVAEDIRIANNTITDARSIAIPILIEGGAYTNLTFRRIQVLNNRVIRQTAGGAAMVVGTPNYSVASPGTVFEDILVEGNVILYAASAPPTDQTSIISFQSAQRSGFVFKRAIIRNNQVRDSRLRADVTGIELRWYQDGEASQNDIRGVGVGISISNNPRSTAILRNLVRPVDQGWGYYFGSSAGRNRFNRNRYFGSPSKPLVAEQVQPSDVIRAPTFESSPPP